MSRESITYQFSCIHWMASFSLNCFSNSYSCKVNTDMFIGADLRSRYVFSTQNKIICKALDFECSPVCFPHPPPPRSSPLRWISGGRPLPASLSYIQGRALPVPRLPAPRSAALLLPASASTVGGNECLAVLVPARLSITLFTCLRGNLLPLVRSEN